MGAVRSEARPSTQPQPYQEQTEGNADCQRRAERRTWPSKWDRLAREGGALRLTELGLSCNRQSLGVLQSFLSLSLSLTPFSLPHYHTSWFQPSTARSHDQARLDCGHPRAYSRVDCVLRVGPAQPRLDILRLGLESNCSAGLPTNAGSAHHSVTTQRYSQVEDCSLVGRSYRVDRSTQGE